VNVFERRPFGIVRKLQSRLSSELHAGAASFRGEGEPGSLGADVLVDIKQKT